MLPDRCPSVCNAGVLWPNGWMIKMKLGTQIDLGPGHTVRWGPSSPSPKGSQTPNFRPISVVAKLLDESR